MHARFPRGLAPLQARQPLHGHEWNQQSTSYARSAARQGQGQGQAVGAAHVLDDWHLWKKASAVEAATARLLHGATMSPLRLQLDDSVKRRQGKALKCQPYHTASALQHVDRKRRDVKISAAEVAQIRHRRAPLG
jgi:hypothetical protein